MQNLAKRMTLQKSALWMFPEGTRSYQSDKSLLDFKKGAFHLAVQGKFPIIMAVVSTYSPRYDEKVKVFRPLTVNVKILEPVYGTNVDQLIESTHARMTECLQTLNTTE
jgi:lysophosphatidate acyltransferase